MTTPQKVLLIVLDGWGIAPAGKRNAITQAHPKFFEQMWKNNPHTILKASGKSVGLPKGFIGNSEVGHLHIGAGRIVIQDLKRINSQIKNRRFYRNKKLLKAMIQAKKTNLHIIMLLSDGGVHGHLEHTIALLKLANVNHVKKVWIHAILDGRDVQPTSAPKYLRQLNDAITKLKSPAKIATIIGRYHALDRDKRWERTKKAYDAIIKKTKNESDSAEEAIIESYMRKETDEFAMPTSIKGTPRIQNNDAVIFTNFRADRAVQLTHAIIDEKFDEFLRKEHPHVLFVPFTAYDKTLNDISAFLPEKLHNTLGEIVSKNKWKQMRIAETEKWAHVTFFFNGLTDKIFNGEERILIPSRKATTYDKTPSMKAEAITATATKIFEKKKYQFILVNYSNPDMLGHTGNIPQTIKSIRFLDTQLQRIVNSAIKNDYAIIITADHGNAEQMEYKDGSKCTAHTTNDVPFILINIHSININSEKKIHLKNKGTLANITPTILKLWNVKKPKEMAKELF